MIVSEDGKPIPPGTVWIGRTGKPKAHGEGKKDASRGCAFVVSRTGG